MGDIYHRDLLFKIAAIANQETGNDSYQSREMHVLGINELGMGEINLLPRRAEEGTVVLTYFVNGPTLKIAAPAGRAGDFAVALEAKIRLQLPEIRTERKNR